MFLTIDSGGNTIDGQMGSSVVFLLQLWQLWPVVLLGSVASLIFRQVSSYWAFKFWPVDGAGKKFVALASGNGPEDAY